MKQYEAERLLNETFNKEFDLARFGSFIRELFKGKIYPNLSAKTLMPYSQFSESIKSFKQIGEYNHGKNNLVVLVVELKKTDSIEKARTMQRNFVGTWLLKGSSLPKDGALVAFHGENPDDWRFSFVKMDYKFDENGKAIKELTPAKRLSYLVGKHEPNHTCRKQFLSLLVDENVPPSFQEIESVFGVENVTKEFFDKYKELFFELRDSLEKMIEKSPNIKKDFEAKQINSTEFSKKLLGQIVFLYFLQKKGWLGVKKENDGSFKDWGTGPRNFMTRLFNQEIVKYNNFFDEILEPLFYEALAKPRDYDYFSRFECKIPFLNGGLFEPIKDYDWVNTKIEIDNDIFRKIIIETFDKFNFTIKEDEPLEREVAVDPEMLGKVFENLLDVNDRKSKGAFYTPREIVHYMCQQSLINYLETNSEIKREDLEKFILKGDLALDYLRRVTDSKKFDVKEEFMIPDSIRRNYEKLDELLTNIKICDPAVGSGAFPVGMMNEIVKARQVLQYFSPDKEKSDYDLKRETIENCLHGVDIEPSAVEITKLRFWLSLIVDENDMQNIKPLPNLDNKIMCGNSLIEEFEGVKLFNDDLISAQIREKEEKQSSLEKYTKQKIKESQLKLERLQRLQKDYFNEDNGPKKKQLMKEIENLEWEFIEATLKEQNNEDALKKLEQYKRSKSKPFFLWKLYFSEVFQRENPGFDVCIANPPYVEFKNLDKQSKLEIEKSFESAKGKYDLYIPFIEKCVKSLSRKKGFITFICPTRFLKRDYGGGIRKFISSNARVFEIIDFTDFQIFSEAMTYTGIFSFINLQNSEGDFYFKKLKSAKDIQHNKIPILMNSKENTIVSEVIPVKLNTLTENPWIFHENTFGILIDKITKNSMTLRDLSEGIYQGIATGKDEVFVLKDDEVKDSRIEEKMLQPFLKGKDIDKYKLKWAKNYVIYPYNDQGKVVPESELKIKFPNLYKYLLSKKQDLSGRAYFDKSNKLWYELWNQRNLNRFKQLKIITLDNAQKNSFCLDEAGFLGSTTSYSIILKNKHIGNYKYLLSLLNSNLLNFYHKNMTIPQAGGFYRYQAIFIENFPIKDIPEKAQKPFIEIVDKILDIAKEEDYLKNPDKQAKVKAYEKQIDKMVYELYELTIEEIKIVEEFGK